MTATEELRRLLDERGVEWWPMHDIESGYREDRDTEFLIYGCKHVAHEWGCRLQVDMLTPEQAIAATLGPGTCRDLGGTGANGEQVFNCSECGCVLSLYDRDGSNNLCTSFVLDYPRYCPECGRKVDADGQG